MAGLCAPLSTLRQYPHGYWRMTRGRCGSLLLHRDGLAPPTPCRSPGALRSSPGNGHPQTRSACRKGAQKQKFTPNSPYSLLRAIRRRGRSRHLAVLAQPVQGLMLTEAAQFEMADFKDRCRNFGGKSTSHEQWPANILAEEFQPAEDVDVAPDGGEVEAIARANIAVCGITIVQSNIDGDMLLDLGR